jgi:trimeric autotransporter adhesin
MTALMLMKDAAIAGVITGTADVSTHVKAFAEATPTAVHSFFAYPGFTGGVRVAVGDVNGDGIPDLITGAGPDSSHVKAFSGDNLALIRSFLAFPGSSTGGVYVAAGDLNGDGKDEIFVSAGEGSLPKVRVFDGATNGMLTEFSAYADSYLGGVRVAAGDVNNDGKADIITGTASTTTNVRVFSGANYAQLQSFLAFGPNLTGGVFVAVGRINGDAAEDLIVATGDGVPGEVRAFNGLNGAILHDFFAYGINYTGGVRVASADVSGDGTSDIVTGTGPGATHVKVFSGTNLNELGSYIAYPGGTTGVHVAAVDASCLADVAPAPFGDGKVSVPDLLMIINNWGACGGYCPSDIAPGPGGDNVVNVQDMLAVINAWGLCQ